MKEAILFENSALSEFGGGDFEKIANQFIISVKIIEKPSIEMHLFEIFLGFLNFFHTVPSGILK